MQLCNKSDFAYYLRSTKKIAVFHNMTFFSTVFREQIKFGVYFMPFLFSLKTGSMLQRKLQVPSSTSTLENPVRDKWTQQSHPAEDSSSRAGPTDAAHDPRTQPAACGEFLVIREEFCYILCCFSKI